MSRADKQYETVVWLDGHSPNLYKIMMVEFNTGGTNFIPIRQTSTRRAEAPAAGDLSVSFSSQSLQDALKQSSQARPEKVAAAAVLLNDSNYPSDAALNRLAGFLAQRI